MASSTSHSESRVPVFALKLLAAALLAWLAGAAYVLFLNPEISFLKGVSRIRTDWTQRMTREPRPKLVAFGGSSCLFSIDGERMLEQHGLLTVNMGAFAGLNAKVLTECALDALQPGDTLVVALEPGLLINDIAPTALACQFSYAMGRPRWIHGRLEPHWPVGPGSLLALRPGAYHTFTLLGKLISGKRLYRYQVEDVRPSGRAETDVRPPLLNPFPPETALRPEAKVLLRSLSQWAATNRVQLCYSLAWAHVSADRAEEFRRLNALFLLNLSEFIPVLKDPDLGVKSDRSLFGDTEWHLSRDGAAEKSDRVARAWMEKQFWTREELQSLAREPR